MKATQINILADRPQVPQDWIIFNAPRPIYGTENWKGEFKEGAFYAAVDPSDSLAQTFIEQNVLLRAVVCNYITEADMEAWAKDLCEREGYDFNELTAIEIKQMYYSNLGGLSVDL